MNNRKTLESRDLKQGLGFNTQNASGVASKNKKVKKL